MFLDHFPGNSQDDDNLPDRTDALIRNWNGGTGLDYSNKT